MLQNQITLKTRAMVGEEITHELGAKMVKDFQDANPNAVSANYIGRNIIERILAQPECEGIRFYNAINEFGRQTLVYVGIDGHDNIISQYVGVNESGELMKEKAIVADRAEPSKDDDWGWF